MVSLKLSALALFAFQAINAIAADADIVNEEDLVNPVATPNIAVSISASFPDSEVFGVKLVNNHATQAVLSIANDEGEPIELLAVGGSLTTLVGAPGAPDPPVILRNLTSTRYGISVPAGEKETLTYSFATEMHPQDVTLQLSAFFQTPKGIFTKQVYNETVSIVEAPTSFFDPQIIFLYLVLTGVFAGTCYFIYQTWITTLFPQKKGRGKGGERAKRSSQGTKKVDPSEQVSVVGADGPAVAASSSAYDESWIPKHHLQRPEAKRVQSGAKPRSRTRAA